MTIAATNLADLRSGLGESVNLLKYAPLHRVQTAAIQVEEAIKFAIFFGSKNDRKSNKKLSLWFHMYPASRPNGYAEIHLNSYIGSDHWGKCDLEVTCKSVVERHAAFQISGVWSKAKLVALAKYYFLEKLAASNVDDKNMQYGVPITESFKNSLRAICRVFEEEAQGECCFSPLANKNPASCPDQRGSFAPKVERDAQGNECNDSTLSDAPSGLLSTEDTRRSTFTAEAHRATASRS